MRSRKRRNRKREEGQGAPLFKIMARQKSEEDDDEEELQGKPVSPPPKIVERKERTSPRKGPKVKTRQKSSRSRTDKRDPTKTRETLVLKTAIKIYSQSMNMKVDELQKFLRSHRDFTVIGALGGQWSGKSTILNHLCQVDVADDRCVFPIATLPNIMRCSHRTTGIDVYVTQERFILLDTQPLLSASVLSMALKDEFTPYLLEPQCLQFCLFMYSVCHVVLVVSDWFIDMEFWRLLRTCFMLKQSMRSLSCVLSKENPDGDIPDTVFIVNKVDPSNMTFSAYGNILKSMQTFFKHDQLGKGGNVSNTAFASLLEEEAKLNLFFLPQKDSTNDLFLTACEELRYQLFSMPKKSTVKLTEKDWARTAARVWSDVENSRALNQYVRVMKKQGIFR